MGPKPRIGHRVTSAMAYFLFTNNHTHHVVTFHNKVFGVCLQPWWHMDSCGGWVVWAPVVPLVVVVRFGPVVSRYL